MARRGAWAFMRRPEGAATLARYEEAIRAGFFDDMEEGYQAALGQPHIGGWSIGQVWALATMHSAILLGQVATVRVQTLGKPAADRQRDVNAAVLGDLPTPFVAALNLQQNGADCDGNIRWTSDIRVTLRPERVGSMPPDRVPLEVGTCSASRILMHLISHGGVARWPYESDDIWILAGWPNPTAWKEAQGDRLGALLDADG